MLVKIINGNKLLTHRKAREMPAFIVTYLDLKYASNTTQVLRKKVFCDCSIQSPNLNQIDENKAPLSSCECSVKYCKSAHLKAALWSIS